MRPYTRMPLDRPSYGRSPGVARWLFASFQVASVGALPNWKHRTLSSAPCGATTLEECRRNDCLTPSRSRLRILPRSERLVTRYQAAKAKALMMLEMVRDINAKFGDGKTHVTCWTCHHASTKPELTRPTSK